MKKFSLVFLAICLLLAFTFPALALTEEIGANKIFVKVDGQGGDSIGDILIYQVKELIRDSKRFTLIDLEDESKEGVFVVQILTLEGDKNGNSTIYSINWLLKIQGVPVRYNLSNTIGYCGRKRVEKAAKRIVAKTDKTIDECLKQFKQLEQLKID
jgi:hypothetical protein